jgi:S-adenosylmethionine:tRNA ribosyltransferase-isomerase
MQTIDIPEGLALSDYDYPLPQELIAVYPLESRDASRMMHLHRPSGNISHQSFHAIEMYLNPGDVLVVNNSKVLPARLFGHRQGHTGRVEILCLNPVNDADPTRWRCLVKPGRKLLPGTMVTFDGIQTTAEILPRDAEDVAQVQFHLVEHASVYDLMDAIGHLPIPHYLGREAEASDAQRYQTVFSSVPGALAAPTAGLHFTPEILTRLKDKGIQIAEVTLLVSIGTFRSIQTEDIRQHRMDAEQYVISTETAQTINQCKANGGRVIAVGTTSLKTLETAIRQSPGGQLQATQGSSDLFIYPGFEFKLVDALLTNFHLPKSTLMMLVSAFAGRDFIMSAYHQAVAERYRFFSYGDCMLIE